MDNLLANRPDLSRDRLERTRRKMDDAIEDCLVTGYEPLISSLVLPDEGDKHVLAAAIACRADVIVTFNLKDFPSAVLKSFGIEAQHPDTFIRHTLDLDPVALAAVRQCRESLKNPPVSPRSYISRLAHLGLPETASFLSDWAELI